MKSKYRRTICPTKPKRGVVDEDDFSTYILTPSFMAVPLPFIIALICGAGLMGSIFISVSLSLVIGLIIFAVMDHKEDKIYIEKMKAYKKACVDAKKEEKMLTKLEEDNKKKAIIIEQKWQIREAQYKKEYSKIDSLLNDFYSRDFIPNNFRKNVYNVSYIYDMMASAQTLSLNEVIFSKQFDEAVKLLAATINRGFSAVIQEMHKEGELLRMQNMQYHNEMNSMNMKKLKQLERTAISSEEQVLYKKLQLNEQRYMNWLIETDLMGLWRK